MNVLMLGGLVLATAALWLLYFERKDRERPEPRWAIALALIAGVGAALLALGAYALLHEGLGLSLPADRPGAMARYALLVVGPLEEGAKLLVAAALVFRLRAFDERLDGLVYGAAVGIGFAAFEALALAGSEDALTSALRALVAPLTHALFAGVFGLAFAQALFARRALARWAWRVGGFALAALGHGAYDALAFSPWSWAASLVILVIWTGVLWRVHALGARRRLARVPGRGDRGHRAAPG